MTDKPEPDSPYDFAPRSDPLAPDATRAVGKPTPLAPKKDQPAEDIAERTCPHCGFRIVGKPVRGRCPECAAALDEVATDLLQFADGAWLATLSNGALIIAASIGLQVLAIVTAWTGEPVAGGILHFLAAAAAVWGVWMATAPEPKAGATTTTLIVLSRFFTLAVGILWLADLFFVHAKARPLMIAILFVMASAAVIVALHLRTLAARIPSDSLASHFVNSGTLTGAACLMIAALWSLDLADTDHLMYFFCSFPLILGIIAVVAWFCLTLMRAALEFRQCATAGRDIVARQAQRARAAEEKRQAH